MFSKSWKPISWKINAKPIEQVKYFRYLGLLFHYKINWSYHHKVAVSLAMNQLPALVCFHFHSGHQYVPAALQVFQVKITNQLLFVVPVWITAANYEISTIINYRHSFTSALMTVYGSCCFYYVYFCFTLVYVCPG